jgi:gliding motility-associated lipoprotein GldH
MKPTKISIMCLSILWALAACDEGRIFEENKRIPTDSWYYKSLVPFDVNITDTQKRYNVYVNVRISSDYKYSNLFLWVNTTNPQRKTDQRRVEIKLANEAGKWLGKGLGDLYDYQFPVFQNISFGTSGLYQFELAQNMRDDTLRHVKSVGVRVEEVIKQQ